MLTISVAVASSLQAQDEGAAVAVRQLWCVAKNNAEDAALQSALDWACGPGGANCGPIQNGGPCYDASDVARMASFAFNDYYVKNHNSGDDACSFSNTAALTDLNPSNFINYLVPVINIYTVCLLIPLISLFQATEIANSPLGNLNKMLNHSFCLNT